MWAANVPLDALLGTYTVDEISEQIPKLRKYSILIGSQNMGITTTMTDINIDTFNDCNLIQKAIDDIRSNRGN